MNRKIKGFTILELSVVLVIASVLITGFFSFTVNKTIDSTIKANNEKLKLLDEAITKFYVSNGYLPCPATHNAPIGSSGFGVSVSPCNSVAAIPGTDTLFSGTSNAIRFGAVPVRTLNLPDSFMFDQWGNRIRYVMVSDLGVNAATYNTSTPSIAVISIVDANNNNMIPNMTAPNHVAYVLTSHGPNNTGAYNYNGAQTISCSGGGLDVENCDITNATFRHSPFVTNSYDDTIAWQTRQVLKYIKITTNKESVISPPSIQPTTKVAMFGYETYGGNVANAAPMTWDRRVINYDVGSAYQFYANDIPTLNDILGLTHGFNNNFVTIPPGTYYLKATQSGCFINHLLVRIATQSGTILAIGNAAYASDETRDCATSEAVGVVTFAVNTNVVVETMVSTNPPGFLQGGYSGGEPALLDISFPWSKIAYATLTLEVQKWD